MKSREFKKLLERLPSLSPKQQTSLLRIIENKIQEETKTVQEIEDRLKEDPCCPDCGSYNIGKWGKAHGLRRYRCRECKRTFNALTGTPLARLRLKEKWDKFSACLKESLSVRASADECGVHRNTAFRWRHRFLTWINENKPQSLNGIVEADETFFLESKKGSRRLSRPARRRGGKASKRGRSSEQICVLVARDRNGQTTDHVLSTFNADVVDKKLGPVIGSDAMLCTDGLNVYSAFAKRKGLLHETVKTSHGERVRAKTIHLQNVNGYHSRLKGWMARFNGVSTRWLSNYLGWRRMLDGRNSLLSPLLVLKSSIRRFDFNTLQ